MSAWTPDPDWRFKELERQRQRIEVLRRSDNLEPPWDVFPGLPRQSMGWRIGRGEDVIVDWELWFRALSDEQRDAYCLRHPEPDGWRGFYEMHRRWIVERHEPTPWDDYWDERMRFWETKYGEA